MPAAGFKPAIPAIERPHNYASDRRATGIGSVLQLARSIAYIPAVEDALVMFIMQILTSVKMCLDAAAEQSSSIHDLEMYVAAP